MPSKMDGFEVLKKQRPKKAIQTKTNMISRSNILKYIVACLKIKLHSHMLYWGDREKNEFVIKFVHMSYPDWKTADYLALFKGLDELSSNYVKYLQDEKYENKCKVRCKSNLRKLDESGAITYMGERKQGKCIHLRTYKLNIDVMSSMEEVSKNAKMTKRSNANGLSGCETVLKIAYDEGKCKTETQPNVHYLSHYLCLSNLNSASSVGPTLLNTYCTTENCATTLQKSSVGPTLLNTYCTTENRNGDIRNALQQIKPLTVYEHEKQMNGIDFALPTSSKQNLANSSTSCSGIEENDKCKSMEYDKFFVENIQESMEIENVHVEVFNDETKTLTQLVPRSPSDLKDIYNPSSEWREDYECDFSKPLQKDDPYLSSTVSESYSNSLLEGNEENFPLDFEDLYMYENLSSKDDG